MEITTPIVVLWCQKQERQKLAWLETFGPDGPKTREDYPKKQRDLLLLETIHYDHARSLKIEAKKPEKNVKAVDISDWCTDQIEDRRDWLARHGPRSKDKRPELEIETKEDDLDVLYHVRRTYDEAIKRKGRE